MEEWRLAAASAYFLAFLFVESVMAPSWSVVLGCAWLMIAPGTHASAAEADPDHDLVRVEMRDGRQLHGYVDDRTDDGTLWLRQESGSIVLASAIAWTDVTAATVSGKSTPLESFRAEADEMASPTPTLDAGGRSQGLQADGWNSMLGQNVIGLNRRPRLQSVEIISLCLANLDRDSEADGIEVSIAAIGDDGLPMSVRGNLSVTLFGERRRAQTADVEFPELAKWNQRVRSEDFSDGVATYRLPFRTVAPEWEFDLLPDAVLSITLGASGHGNFQAAAPIVVRPFNVLRDNLQQWRGTRFLPGEAPGRAPVHRLTPVDGLWLHWTR
jgi:hypothetical protein